MLTSSSFVRLFSELRRNISAKFPDDLSAGYVSVTGFFFLRYIVPSILSPPLFDLDVGVITDQASRNLKLISKTLQNLANLVEFGQKEQFMAVMNPFISEYQGRMKLLIDLLSVTFSQL
jgi:Ras GTPase-activating protein 1